MQSAGNATTSTKHTARRQQLKKTVETRKNSGKTLGIRSGGQANRSSSTSGAGARLGRSSPKRHCQRMLCGRPASTRERVRRSVKSRSPRVVGVHGPLADGVFPTITFANKVFPTLGSGVGHSGLRGRAGNLGIEQVNQVGHIGALGQDQTGHIGCSVGQVSRQRPSMDRGTGSRGGGLSTCTRDS